jgi:hypothetical protein
VFSRQVNSDQEPVEPQLKSEATKGNLSPVAVIEHQILGQVD